MFLKYTSLLFSFSININSNNIDYKVFFKNTKMSQMLLRIGFVKFLIFRLFSKFTVIRKNNYKRVFNEGNILTGN